MKFVSLLSSGIDSPVATYLISKKADEIILVHGDIRPFTDNKEIENFKNLAVQLKKIIKCSLKIYVIPHGKSLNFYKKRCNDRYTCIFCKRMLLRYAEIIAEKKGAKAIIMGDSLGQVASQTLQNIKVIDQAVKIPILRPLIGFDKDEIVKIAKEIGTYELSILPSKGCNAVPKKPATKTKLENILNEEKKINIEKLLNDAINETEFLSI